MDIRSVTLFCEAGAADAPLAHFLQAARHAFPYPVQSTRMATPPFPDWWPQPDATTVAHLAQQTAARGQALGVDYISLGPVLLRHDPVWLNALPVIFATSDALFATAEIADTSGNLDTGRCWHVADIIRRVSTVSPNGFGNLYLAALANCPPGSPFFPVAYHQGGAPTFAIAVESADLALDAIQAAKTLPEARANLVAAIEEEAGKVVNTAVSLAQEYNIPFHGIDFSLAPYPTDSKSLGGAMEALGLPHVGAAGSLFAAGFITEAIERANFPRCGFSGLMLPVLEDSVLARRAAAGVLTVQDLLSYSAVCGVGLDTIPLPGDISQDSLTAILLDVAMLATRLRKPLTARLMPLPGLQAGDPVTFDFAYFADSRVMAVRGETLQKHLRQSAHLTIEHVRQSKSQAVSSDE
ncbi:MAG: DUF711 family protein [Ardenticatenaceae bacterium]|nr:DUF711 family protein [Ardenticatenaceae bacterium]MCB8989221.1 DUF711 family protein [Ardenticatenaceae bacterium]